MIFRPKMEQFGRKVSQLDKIDRTEFFVYETLKNDIPQLMDTLREGLSNLGGAT